MAEIIIRLGGQQKICVCVGRMNGTDITGVGKGVYKLLSKYRNVLNQKSISILFIL